jgi:hypothetical protein
MRIGRAGKKETSLPGFTTKRRTKKDGFTEKTGNGEIHYSYGLSDPGPIDDDFGGLVDPAPGCGIGVHFS